MAYHKMLAQIKTRGKYPRVSLLLSDGPELNLPRSAGLGNRIAKSDSGAENGFMYKEGQRVRANLAGMQAGGVLFHAAVTDAVGNIVRQTSENPPVYLVRLLFSFKGVNEVEVPAERITAF